MAADRRGSQARRPPPRASSLLLGLGLGGFLDGIVLHQILQWHHMVSSVDAAPTDTVPGLQLNTLADGFFHLATWLLVVAASITRRRYPNLRASAAKPTTTAPLPTLTMPDRLMTLSNNSMLQLAHVTRRSS